MARTVIGCRVCLCKLVKNKIALYDPNSPLPTHRHCWCQPIAPFDPVQRILQYPFYKNEFRIYPMEDEYFMEKILLNVRLGNPVLGDSWLEIYTSNSNPPFCRNTMYNQSQISQNLRVRWPLSFYQPLKYNGCVQSLQAKCCEVLLYTFPADELITEDFSQSRKTPFTMAKYTYHMQIILNSKVPYETRRLKIQFLVELHVEKAAEKHGMNNVRNFMFKKHPDSGRVHVLSQDTHLFLPYDLTALRHPPFLSSSPRADN